MKLNLRMLSETQLGRRIGQLTPFAIREFRRERKREFGYLAIEWKPNGKPESRRQS